MSVSSRVVKIVALKSGVLLADKCVVADGFLSRLRGLLGKQTFVAGEGLLIRPCNDIHMWFMRFPIDVVFVEAPRSGAGGAGEVLRVTSVHRHVPAWKALPLRDGRAAETLELPVGTIERTGIRPGDDLLCSS